MVNFGERTSVPSKYEGRNFYIHNPQVTLMRTTPDECAQLGRIIAEKANACAGKCSIMIPTKAISVISAESQPFHDPKADDALYTAIRKHSQVPVVDYDEEINSPVFARACAEELLALMERRL
jgi:uncharacterized protein (UPF0261 family)